MSKPEPKPGKSRYLDGSRLRLRRARAGLTQEELGALVGISRAHVAHHEAGDYGCHMTLLSRYATALGCSEADLMHAKARKGLRIAIREAAAALEEPIAA